jgi:UDP-2,3-diacylglucosamine hydrolase
MDDRPIALIGGEGKMPRLIIEGIHASKRKILLFAIKGITPPDLAKYADETVWLYLTQLGKAINECCKRNIVEITMAGRVRHSEVFSLSLLRMDWVALNLWWNMKDWRADTILASIADTFKKRGITLINSIRYLSSYLSKEGVLTHKLPSKKVMADVYFGIKIAKKMGGLDIGQTVVIKNKTIVAVEAMEGTDQCLERAGQIAGTGCVVIKMAKPSQDMRFDVPIIGVNTIEKLAKIGAFALAIEANKTIIIDKQTISAADQMGIALISLPQENEPTHPNVEHFSK